MAARRKRAGNIRMTPTMFHILLCMVDGEKHGYAIKGEVAARTGGKVKLGPGSLYWAIQRLEGAGLIEETDSRKDPELDDERRVYYRLTRRGRSVLREEAESLAEIVRFASAKNLIHL